jgi:hypothetical protein
LVEDAAGFALHSAASITALIAAVRRVHDDDCCYFNTYRLTEDWRPPRPGTDYMGAINHVHLSNWHLDRMRAGGLDALW